MSHPNDIDIGFTWLFNGRLTNVGPTAVSENVVVNIFQTEKQKARYCPVRFWRQ